MEESVYLPYKSVVLFIACGALVFIIVFIFAKRQITRFALKSNRVPHAAIGDHATKAMKEEIERRLRRVTDVTFEPILLSPLTVPQTDSENYQFYFRMKALDSLKSFDKQLDLYFPAVRRSANHSLRLFLLDLRLPKKGALHGIVMDVIERFCELYDHARHNPADFKQEQYQEFMDLLNHLTEHIHKRYVHNTTIEDITDSVNHGLLKTDATDAKPGILALNTDMPAGEADTTTHHEMDSLPGDVPLVSRETRVNEGESGCLLLEGRDSSASSQGSLTDTEVTYRGHGINGGNQQHTYL